MKAFIFDPLWYELVTDELTKKLNDSGLDVTIVTEVAPLLECKELFEGDEDRILCFNPDYVGWKVTVDDYKTIPNLKGIFGAATSFSYIDVSYANENNIPVCNTKNWSTQSVAEWAVTMMFNLARQTPRLTKDKFPLDFDADFMKYRGIELKGKTVGVIGLGNIGSAIAERAQGLGMDVVYWSQSDKDCQYEKVDLNKLFSNADVIFPTMAINDETKELITPKLLSSIKPSAILITIAHGLYEDTLPLQMVKEGKLFGYGFEAQPGTFNDYEGNVWAAPAYAWATAESMHNSMARWVENMVNAAKGEFPNRVN